MIALLSVQSLSLIMLISFFYTTNLEYKYVSDYSSTDLNLFYKFSGLWAGRDGTLLIWTWSATLFMILERKFNPTNDRQKELTTAICCLLIFGLSLIQLYINPFRTNRCNSYRREWPKSFTIISIHDSSSTYRFCLI